MKKLKPRRNQKCWLCKKPIVGGWAYNGYWWHENCIEKDVEKRVKKYLWDRNSA